jgi:hypothetical protein
MSTALLQPPSVHEPSMSIAEVSRVQGAIEARAHEEWANVDKRALAWLCDTHDISDIAQIVFWLTQAEENACDAKARAYELECDYVQTRSANASEEEWQEVGQSLRQDGEIE